MTISNSPKRVLVAFDGASASIGMLDYALQFCAPAKRVTVLRFGAAPCPDAGASTSALYRILATHDAQHQKISVVDAPPGNSVVAAITTMGRTLRSDLIILAMQRERSGSTAIEDRKTVIEAIALTEHIPVMALRPEMVGQSAAAVPVRRILVPLDGSVASRQACSVATALAHQFRAAVHLVTVIDPIRMLPAAYAYLPERDPERRDAIAWLAYQANQALDRAEAVLRAAGIRATSALLTGSTPDRLLATIADGDVIVMATHGDRKGMQARFGSVAFAVVGASPVPVIVLHAPPWLVQEAPVPALWMLDAESGEDSSQARPDGDPRVEPSPAVIPKG